MASTNNQRMWPGSVVALLLAALLGCSPVSQSIVKKAQSGQNLNTSGLAENRDFRAIPASLPSFDRIMIQSYGEVVQRYSRQYGLDWRLVLAVMKAESGFSHDNESEKGATGLMQMMPVTSDEVSRLLDIQDMTHPSNNIRGGIYYLRKLYGMFAGAEEKDRLELTLASYNAGVGRIYDAQVLAAYLNDNPMRWEAVKEALPILSKRYYTLHQHVWEQDRPKIAGWFGNSSETITYVDRVMGFYENYRDVLN